MSTVKGLWSIKLLGTSPEHTRLSTVVSLHLSPQARSPRLVHLLHKVRLLDLLRSIFKGRREHRRTRSVRKAPRVRFPLFLLSRTGTRLSDPLRLHTLQRAYAAAIEEHERAADEHVAIPPEVAPRPHGRAHIEDHERDDRVVEDKDSDKRAGDIIGALDRRSRGQGRAPGVDVVGGQDERADVPPAEALCGLDESSEGEGQVVPAMDTVLLGTTCESTYGESDWTLTHIALVVKVSMLLLNPGFLPFGVTRL